MTTEAEDFAQAPIDEVLTRSEAAALLGISDTEFALRMIWDGDFPGPLAGGRYRLADILAWREAHGRSEVLPDQALRG
jgi:predicted DNA-binding transcriptional regulator AlpA